MPIKQWIIPNLYRDSVSLMLLSDQIQSLDGINQASTIMATETNISLLVESGFLSKMIQPRPNDLLVVIDGDDNEAIQRAMEFFESLLTKIDDDESVNENQTHYPKSIQMSFKMGATPNLALISTPGTYAAAEALKAMHLGLHVMMFSDNVDHEEEVLLKKYSEKHNYLFMGPDCGTAIINGIPLGFANVVNSGPIGIVAASGTGLQQVTCLIDRYGLGISQAIGTGGHDLSAEVGGVTMKQGIRALSADPGTKVIVLISKPPSSGVMESVLKEAEHAGKPVVIIFIGADHKNIVGERLYGVPTLEAAAKVSVKLVNNCLPDESDLRPSYQFVPLSRELAQSIQPGQKYIRGLFCGGTFCFETLHLLGQHLGPVYSNIPINPAWRLENVWKSQAHTVIDLGDDLFTQGRPHPMIDFRLRNERLLEEAQDPHTAIILLDIVLGYGSHNDPAGEIVPTIQKAREIAHENGRQLVFIASICGTHRDPQNLAHIEKELLNIDVTLAESNAQAALLAGAIISQLGELRNDQ